MNFTATNGSGLLPVADLTSFDDRLLLGLTAGTLALLCTLLAIFSVEAAGIVAGCCAAAVVLARPFVGIPIVFLLGMLGDLQHFTGGISVVKGVMFLMVIAFVARHPLATIRQRATGVEIPLMVFIAIYCAGNTIRPSETYNSSVILTWIGYPFAFLLVLYLVRTRRQIEWSLGALAVGATLASFSTAIEQFTGINLLSSLRGVDEVIATNGPQGMERISGVFQEANAAAYMYIVAIPILVAVLLTERSRLQKAVAFAMMLVCMFGLLISFSRSGYIAVLIALGCVLFFMKLRKALSVVVSVVLLVVILSPLIPFTAVIDRFYQIQNEIGGESDRSLYYETSARLIVQNPLIPAGEDRFMNDISDLTGVPQGPHSNIMSAGVNGGLFGLAAILWLFVTYGRFILRKLRTMPASPLRWYAIATFAGMIGFQVQGLFMTNFGWFLMWAAAALPLCCILVEDRRNGSRTVAAE
jgi:O-Antigen ligase